MTYNVFGGTLNFTQQPMATLTFVCVWCIDILWNWRRRLLILDLLLPRRLKPMIRCHPVRRTLQHHPRQWNGVSLPSSSSSSLTLWTLSSHSNQPQRPYAPTSSCQNKHRISEPDHFFAVSYPPNDCQILPVSKQRNFIAALENK